MTFGIFQKLSEAPALIERDIGYPRSNDVLGLMASGNQAVVRYCQTDDSPDTFGWITACSNGFDVTNQIVGWTELPAAAMPSGLLDYCWNVDQAKRIKQSIEALDKVRNDLLKPLLSNYRALAAEQLHEVLQALPPGEIFCDVSSQVARSTAPFQSLSSLPKWLVDECLDEVRKHGWPNQSRISFIKQKASELGYSYNFAGNLFIYAGEQPEPLTDPRLKEDSYSEEIASALEIVGAEDFSDDGRYGSITVHGAFANAIISEQLDSLETRKRFGVEGEPVRISRMGRLEVWCNGFYVEGRGVRKLVHDAARKLLGTETEQKSKPGLADL